MTPSAFIEEIVAILDRYVSGKITGRECVRHFDALMADDLPDELPEAVHKSLDSFQDDSALYVEDDEQRKEHPSYYGPDTLLHKVTCFRELLKTVPL